MFKISYKSDQGQSKIWEGSTIVRTCSCTPTITCLKHKGNWSLTVGIHKQNLSTMRSAVPDITGKEVERSRKGKTRTHARIYPDLNFPITHSYWALKHNQIPTLSAQILPSCSKRTFCDMVSHAAYASCRSYLSHGSALVSGPHPGFSQGGEVRNLSMYSGQ